MITALWLVVLHTHLFLSENSNLVRHRRDALNIMEILIKKLKGMFDTGILVYFCGSSFLKLLLSNFKFALCIDQ